MDNNFEYITGEISPIPTKCSAPFRSVPLDLSMPALYFDQIGCEIIDSVDNKEIESVYEPPQNDIQLFDDSGASKQNETGLVKKCRQKKKAIVTPTPKENVKKWMKKKINIQTLEGSFAVPAWSPENDDSNQEIVKIKHEMMGPLVDINQNVQNTIAIKPCKPKSKNNKENKEKIFPCPEKNCNKLFSTQSGLKKHSLIHGPRQHVCLTCNKGFVEKGKLRRHELVHTEEKPFICHFEGCSKPFKLEYNLKTHIRLHTGVKRYECPVDFCKRKFSEANNLRLHMNLHKKL